MYSKQYWIIEQMTETHIFPRINSVEYVILSNRAAKGQDEFIAGKILFSRLPNRLDCMISTLDMKQILQLGNSLDETCQATN